MIVTPGISLQSLLHTLKQLLQKRGKKFGWNIRNGTSILQKLT